MPIFQPSVQSDRHAKMHFSLSRNDVRDIKGILCQLSWNQIFSFSTATVSAYWRDLPHDPLLLCIYTRFVGGDFSCKGKNHVADIRHSFSFTPRKSVCSASRQLSVRKTTVLKIASKALISVNTGYRMCGNWYRLRWLMMTRLWTGWSCWELFVSERGQSQTRFTARLSLQNR